MNTPISFELSKKLKEKGFNKECFYYYSSTGDLIEPYEENGSSIDTEFRVELSDLLDYHNYQYLSRYAAPTIAEVVMWLYDKHGIWIEVRKSYLLNQFVAVTKNPRVELSSKDSPIEAYEAAIEYTLKNLI